MRPLRLACLLPLLLAACASVPTGAVRHGGIDIDHALLMAADTTGVDVAAYAGFDNRGAPDRLLGIDCDCATTIELHEVVRNGEDMQMNNVFPLALPPGRTEVRPPGIPLHFMLMQTRRAFTAGERVVMRLRFERAGPVDVAFAVVARSGEAWDAWPDVP